MNYKGFLKGIPASRGIAEGKVKIVGDYESSLNLIFEKGNILVAEKTYPDLVMYMEKASAIVTNSGGMLSHAAIVSRELNIPCVVGTEKATEILKEGMIVKVDGNQGMIYHSLEDESEVPEETENLQISKSPGLSYLYNEIEDEFNKFLENYKDISFKVSDEHAELLDKFGNAICLAIINHAIPLMRKNNENVEWISKTERAVDFYRNAETPSQKMIAITWMDKIMRATSFE